MATPSAPVETKIRAATAVATVLGLVVTVLNAVGTNSALLGSTPPWIQSIVTLLAPPLAVFIAGWIAPHTPRPTPAPAPVAAVTVVPAAVATAPVVPQAVDPAPVSAVPPTPPAAG
ncbi:hypothetical protein [Kitasatospora sp. GP82]|uniref:hypothetical protein n=1 Tax=Kitasatospora sp. GP82 TaxID=3035089 RepID=UPI0024771901|nr:hypothetical protein [Kitasatospora sp. GP82]MDH6123454.1 hypothetical protein [Kitasatospora sp. GP82]